MHQMQSLEKETSIMNRTRFAVLSILGLTISAGAIASEKVPKATLDNLQAAFSGERNAHTRYAAFAKQADKEGFSGAASLFRAAARAEEIHAANHAAVIKKYGAVPREGHEDWMVKSTSENLLAGIRGEAYERDQMYPSFIVQAEGEGAGDALRTFRLALDAEAEHAKLYQYALDHLNEMMAKRTFSVCPVCGFTADNTDLIRCPTCATPKERFEQVS
jgi:rubrerythrin